MRAHQFGVVALLALTMVPAAVAQTTVAVLQFENRDTDAVGWKSGATDDSGWLFAASTLERALTKSGKFKIVERASLTNALGTASRVDGRFGTAVEAKLGTDLGAKYIIYGTVTNLDVVVENETTKLPGIKVDTSETEGHVSVQLTAVDPATGKVVATATGSSEEEGNRKLGVRDDDDAETSATGDAAAAGNLVDEAAGEAIDNAVEQLAKALP
jgi:curli biogenesis system outer membrane secretion channel CsgG